MAMVVRGWWQCGAVRWWPSAQRARRAAHPRPFMRNPSCVRPPAAPTLAEGKGQGEGGEPSSQPGALCTRLREAHALAWLQVWRVLLLCPPKACMGVVGVVLLLSVVARVHLLLLLLLLFLAEEWDQVGVARVPHIIAILRWCWGE